MAGFQILHQIAGPFENRERVSRMLVHQLTVVHQLLPPLEDEVSELTEVIQLDAERTSRDKIRHDVRGLNDRKNQLRYFSQSADRIEICFSKCSHTARVGVIMRHHRMCPGLTRVCSTIHRWRTPVKMPTA